MWLVGETALRLHMDEHVAKKYQVLLPAPVRQFDTDNLFQRVYDEEFQMQQDRMKRQRSSGPVAFHAISASNAAAAAAAAAAAGPSRGQLSLSSFLTKKQ